MMLMINFVSPLAITFAVILIGYAIGKIRIGNVSLDLSAILLVAIFWGFVMSEIDPSFINEELNNTMSAYSKLGTAVFVSVIGITAGASLGASTKKSILYFLVGCFSVLGAFAVTAFMEYIAPETDKSLLLGALSGALTSTPGLSVISERQDLIAERTVIGYGTAYIIGVVIVIIVTQLARSNSLKRERSDGKITAVTVTDGTVGILLVAICALFGEMFGNLSVGGYSLGTTCAILICGIVIGCITRKTHIIDSVEHSFPIYRNLGIMLFFVGNGMLAGAKLKANINITFVVCGAVITIASVMAVWLACKILKLDTCSLIAGSMTSTPALGVLVRKGYKVDLTAYSISYVGALLTMTVGIKFV